MNDIDTQIESLPNWVCTPDDGNFHLTTYEKDKETGLSGCSKHPIAGGCTIPQQDLKTLLIQGKIDELDEIELAQQDTDKWSGFCMDDTSDFGNYIEQRKASLKRELT